MGLFNQRAAAGISRRYLRVLKQRCKTAGLCALALAVVCGAGAALWKSGSVSRITAEAMDRTVTATAAAGFRAQDILVTGADHLTRDAVVRQLGIRTGTPIFSVDLDAARENLLKMPWVKDARLVRRLPGSIAVAIEERTPAALWQVNRRVSVIDEDGVVLTAQGLDAYKSLPLVVGAGAGAAAADLIRLLAAEPLIGAQVASAVRIGARRWDLHLNSGVVVMLPAADEGLALAQFAQVAQEKNLLSRNIVRVDLRLQGRLVVAPGVKAPDGKETI